MTPTHLGPRMTKTMGFANARQIAAKEKIISAIVS